MSDRRDIEELWARRASGQPLKDEDDRRLREALEQDPELRAQLQADDWLDGALAGWGRAQGDDEAFLRRLAPALAAEGDGRRFVTSVEQKLKGAAGEQHRQPRRRWLSWTLVPTLLVAAGVTLWVVAPRRADVRPVAREQVGRSAPSLPPRLPTAGQPGWWAEVVQTRGQVGSLSGGPVQPGARLAVGDGLAVGVDGDASVVSSDGSRLSIGAGSTATWLAPSPGQALLLVRGSLRADVSPQPADAPLRIVTPHAEATVLGTRFRLTVAHESTRLDVEQGRVRLRARGDQEGGGRDVEAGQFALAASGSSAVTVAAAGAAGGVLLLVNTPLGEPDQRLEQRLRGLGLTVKALRVRTAEEAEAAVDEARRSALVIISTSASAYHLHTRLREQPVPLLVLDALLFDDLGMTGLKEDAQAGSNWSNGQVDIKDAGHPVAAGLPPGPLRVFTERATVAWGVPGPLAVWVATVGGDPTRAAVFAYEQGAQMPGLQAPARRVGFFLRGTGALHLNDDGWALFDAAVRWAIAAKR